MEFLHAQEEAALRAGAAHDDIEAQILMDALESQGDIRVAAWRGDLAAFRKDYLAPEPAVQPAPVAPPATVRFRWRYAAAAAAVLAVGTALFPRGGGRKEEGAEDLAQAVPAAKAPVRLAARGQDAAIAPDAAAYTAVNIVQVQTGYGADAQYFDVPQAYPLEIKSHPVHLDTSATPVRRDALPATGAAALQFLRIGMSGGVSNSNEITQVSGSGPANQSVDSTGN